jgi:hypothetical protein
MKNRSRLPLFALAAAGCCVAMSSAAAAAGHAGRSQACARREPLLIDDRPSRQPQPRNAPAPVDVGQDLPADLPNKPPPPPTGKVAQEIDQLIRQLGADDFRARDSAAARLREIGNDALAPLAQAKEDPDPEVASRAAGIIRQITHRTSLFARIGRGGRGNGLGQRVRVSVGPGGVQTEAFQGGDRIEITETPAGQITVTAIGIEDGRSVSQRVSASSPAELRAKDADAAALYERFGAGARGGAGMLRLNGPGAAAGRLLPPGVPGPFIIRGAPNAQLQLGPAAGVVPDDLPTLRRDTLKRMAQQNVPAERQAEVLRRLDELIILQLAGDPADDDATRLRRMQAYNDKSDELRKVMSELKLPDPGPALPPPAQARLGITVEGEGPDGVVVGKVLEGSRGGRIGLKTADRIHSVNGKPVTTAVELRKLVSAPGKLKITLVRDGAEKVLEEKAVEGK